MQPDSPQRNDSHSVERYAPAFVLITVGAVFLLNNLHILSAHEIWLFWPVILIVAGVFKLVDSDTDQGRIGGAVVLVIGAIFLASNLDLLPVRVWALWPLLLIGLGILMLINRFPLDLGFSAEPPRDATGVTGGFHMRGNARATIHDFAIFGGGKRKINSEHFERANFDAVFGGFEIDMRSAVMAGDSAVIEINAVFGGAEIKIPESWSAVVRGIGVFGAFTDNSVQPNAALFPHPKILHVKGAAVFGGVNVKN
jgi:hypothetical protein